MIFALVLKSSNGSWKRFQIKPSHKDRCFILLIRNFLQKQGVKSQFTKKPNKHDLYFTLRRQEWGPHMICSGDEMGLGPPTPQGCRHATKLILLSRSYWSPGGRRWYWRLAFYNARWVFQVAGRHCCWNRVRFGGRRRQWCVGRGKHVSEHKEVAFFTSQDSCWCCYLVFLQACSNQHGQTPELGNQVAVETTSP